MSSSSFFHQITFYLHSYWYDIADPRTAHFPILNWPPFIFFSFMMLYVLSVTKLIPTYMKHRPPYDNLRKLIFIYNLSLVFINAYFFVLILTEPEPRKEFWTFKYPSREDKSLRRAYLIKMAYLYFLSKFLDLLDTIFFALRKKDSHITFLHLYHHTVVPILGWTLLKINPQVPAGFLFAFCNTFVHTIMYSYYALSSAFGATKNSYIQSILWWKRYITLLQLVQFIIYGIYACLVIIFQSGYPQFWMWFAVTQPPFFFYMFYDFYRLAYGRKDATKIQVQLQNGNSKNCYNNNHQNHNNNDLNGLYALKTNGSSKFDKIE